MKKKIPKSGYRVLAIIWTLAAASIAVALVRRLPYLNLVLLALLILSIICAASWWRAYHRTPEEAGSDPFHAPPKFADNPVLFDDPPPPSGGEPSAGGNSSLPHQLNKDSEEKNHER